MTNLVKKTTSLAMHIVCGYTFPGSVIVDATCGNGHDTLALAGTSPAKLYAFDIQQEAVNNTRSRLLQEGFGNRLADGTISIICDSHRLMPEYVREKANVIVFNLGYLPGGDKTKTTCTEETVSAVKAALDILAKDGILCITMYGGHEEGRREKERLLHLAETLDRHVYHAAYIDFINQKNDPPDILLITRT